MSFQFYKDIRNEIESHKYIFLSTAVGNNSSSVQVQYFNDGFELYCVIPEKSKMSQQLEFSNNVEAIIDTASKGKSKGILFIGRAEKVSDKDKNIKYTKKLIEKFSRFKNYFIDKNTILIKILPIEIKRINYNTEVEQNVLTFKENKLSNGKAIKQFIISTVRSWVMATRLPFITASLGSVFVGASVAWYQNGRFDLSLFLLTVLGTIFAHLGANMINDYFDHLSGNDVINKCHNQFTGGSRVIQDGIFSPQKVYITSILFFIITTIIGIYLNFVLPGNTLLIIGAIGLFLAGSYSAKPLQLAYRGLGEITVGLAFGITIAIGTYFVQTGEISYLPVLASIPLSILVFLILFINEFQDYSADKQAGKKTLVVRINNKLNAIRVYQVMLFLPFIYIIPFVIMKIFPIWILLTLLPIPIAIKAVQISSVKFRQIKALLPVNQMTIGLHFITAILLTIGFVLGKLF